MKKIIKKNYKFILGVIIGLVWSSGIAYAATILFDSDEVSYDNTTSGLSATNVQSALDELYVESTSYQLFEERVTTLESMIQDNAGFHNSIFRGKDVTSYYTDGTLYTRISSGKFTDLYVGDYIVKNGVNWRIAGFDVYLHKGDSGSGLTTHHAVIVPDTSLTTSYMNSSNTTTGGYKGSYMYTTKLPSVLSTYITPVFSSHVLSYRNLVTNSINSSLYNRGGSAGGGSNGWSWETKSLDLMNEVQVYGSISWSSTGLEVGSGNTQFPLFRLAPEYIQKERANYWLRNVASSAAFTIVGIDGYSGNTNASSAIGVRPYFYID